MAASLAPCCDARSSSAAWYRRARAVELWSVWSCGARVSRKRSNQNVTIHYCICPSITGLKQSETAYLNIHVVVDHIGILLSGAYAHNVNAPAENKAIKELENPESDAATRLTDTVESVCRLSLLRFSSTCKVLSVHTPH